MNKKTKYAINGAIWIGLLNAGLNAFRQWREMSNNAGQKFDWERIFIAAGKGALVGGGSGLLIGAIIDHQNSKEVPIDTDTLLQQHAQQVKLDNSDPCYKSLERKGQVIVDALQDEYSDILAKPAIPMGSTQSGTALKGSFDLDYGLLFKAKSFQSTKHMYEDVSNYLEESKENLGITAIRKQRKSIGLFVDAEGMEQKIDVVPCKKSTANKTSGYLYKKNDSLFSSNSSYTKTDIPLLKKRKLSKSQEELLVILKDWRNKNNIPIGSHLLQNLVLDAYANNKGSIPRGLTKKLVMVSEHVHNHLGSMKLKSIENTNNVITDIAASSKRKIINAFGEIIEDYRYQPNSIVRNMT